MLEEARGINLDDPSTLEVHRRIIQSKPFLRRTYVNFYRILRREIEQADRVPGQILELGSGGGFLKSLCPEVVTSEVCPCAGVDRTVNAESMPFENGGLRGVLMLNVLHHLPDPRAFFREATRCLASGGRIVMIEPYRSVFAKWIYQSFHQEPFDDSASVWEKPPTGRLSASNQALPWIIFSRDRAIFEKEYPELRILRVRPHTFLTYVISGGLTWKSFAPGFTYRFFSWLDRLFARFPGVFPMFATIVVERRKN